MSILAGAIPLTNEQFQNLLEPILYEAFHVGQEMAGGGESVLQLFGQANSTKATETIQSLGNFASARVRKGGNPVNQQALEELFTTTFTNVEYQETVPVDDNLVKDQQYMTISDMANELGQAFETRRRSEAASVYNNAFSSSYLGGDGVALCATNHPLDAAGSSTQGNKGTSALSYTSVAATRALMRKFQNSTDRKLNYIPTHLVVPPELEESAWQICNAMGKPGTADNDENYNRILTPLVDPYLSDTNNWFLVTNPVSQLRLKWFSRESLEFSFDMPVSNDRNWYMGAFERYSYGWSDWRWVYGHEVA